MGRAVAGLWLLGLSLYFMVISFLFYNANNINITYGLTSNITGGTFGISESNYNARCVDPSDSYDSVKGYFLSGNEKPYVTNTITEYDNCNSMIFWNTNGSIDRMASICNNVNGCTYLVNQTKYIFGIPYTDSASFCNGTIDYTSYNINISNWGVFNKTSDFCTNANISNVYATCQAFGCYWSDPDKNPVGLTANDKGYLSTLIAMFTADIDIGLPSEWAIWFYLLFVWLPLLALSMALYIYAVG